MAKIPVKGGYLDIKYIDGEAEDENGAPKPGPSKAKSQKEEVSGVWIIPFYLFIAYGILKLIQFLIEGQ